MIIVLSGSNLGSDFYLFLRIFFSGRFFLFLIFFGRFLFGGRVDSMS